LHINYRKLCQEIRFESHKCVKMHAVCDPDIGEEKSRKKQRKQSTYTSEE